MGDLSKAPDLPGVQINLCSYHPSHIQHISLSLNESSNFYKGFKLSIFLNLCT